MFNYITAPLITRLLSSIYVTKGMILFVLLISVLLFQNCKSPTAPSDNAVPGRRDYTWTVDTLMIPYSSVYRMWGNDPNNVWIIGRAGDFDKTIYH